MKGVSISKWVAVSLCGLFLQGTASAQIYESEDAQGVPEFSDTPTPGAEVVDLPATNLVAPPAEEPVAPGETQPTQQQGMPATVGGDGQEEGVDGAVYYGGDDVDNPREQRRIDEDRIDNALPGNPVGPGVGAPGPGIEPGPGVNEGGMVGEPGAVRHEEGGGRR
jgi:hypothetical protein